MCVCKMAVLKGLPIYLLSSKSSLLAFSDFAKMSCIVCVTSMMSAK